MREFKGNIDIQDVTPIEQAKELWPDWYERRIKKGQKKDVGISSVLYMIGGLEKSRIK